MIKKRFEARAYPDPLFMGYQLRFGTVMACFATPRLQRIANCATPLKGNGFIGVVFHNKDCVWQLGENSQSDELINLYVGVLEDWPSRDELIDASPYRRALYASLAGVEPVTLSDNDEAEQTNGQDQEAAEADHGGTPVLPKGGQVVRDGGQRIRRRRKISPVL